MTRLRRGLVAFGAAGVAAAVLLAPTSIPRDEADASSGNHAGLVVRFGDGEVRHQCISFGEQQITGWELLRRSQFDVVSRQFGSRPAICMLDGEGCSADDCWCSYPAFWGYWNREKTGDDWTFASAGSSDRVVRQGSIDGWSWGPNGMPAPPRLSFGQVCPAAGPPASTAGPTPVPPPVGAPPVRPLPTSTAAQTPATSLASPGVAGVEVTPSPSPTPAPSTPTPSASPGSPLPRAQADRVAGTETAGAGYLAFAAFVAAMVAAGAAAAFTRRRARSSRQAE